MAASFNSLVIGGITLTPWLSGYTTSWEGEEIEFTASTTPQAIFRAKRLVIEITVNDSDQGIYQQLLSLAEQQDTEGILVRDYISPDSGTVTDRRVYIADVKQVSGSITKDNKILTKGTSLKLIEINPRIW